MTTGLWVLLVSVLLVVGFAVYRVATDGRFRSRGRSQMPPPQPWRTC